MQRYTTQKHNVGKEKDTKIHMVNENKDTDIKIYATTEIYIDIYREKQRYRYRQSNATAAIEM